jgi:WD40 repeat protein
MYDAFLSYARDDDEPFVRQLYADLTGAGFEVWFDRVCMPSRALTFLQEIRDAVEKADRLLAVIGPAAVRSDYVLSEWRHALLFAKGVVPLLRLGDFDLLPEGLAGLHCVDCRPSRPRDQALAELMRLLKEPIPPLGTLLTLVPSLPPHFQPRRADLERLSELVLADVQRPTVITSPRQVSALQGMGGIGKSVLAAAFARATTTRRACTDGVIWIAIGPQPDLVRLMSLVGTVWGEAPHHFASLETAQARLPRVLEGKVCLLVLDDVWQLGHATPFVNALGPRCRLLITTRDAGLGRALGAQEHWLGLLSPEAARQLLADWLSVPAEALPQYAAQVARRCGYLPLALALCGALARDGVPWRDLLEALEEADLAFLKKELKDYPYPDVYRALMVSLDYLARENPVGAQHYQELAVFPPAEGVPQDPVLRLWRHTNGVTDRQARKLLANLAQKALLLLAREAERCRVSLHDLQHAFLMASAKEKEGGLAGLHQCLLAAYGKECGEGWAKGPDDDYFFQHLAHHLTEAGRKDELRRLLLNFHWFRARLGVTDIQGLISDYDFLPEDPELRLVQGALRLSAHVLARDKNQMAGQLTGRLLGFESPGIQGLHAQIQEAQTGMWLRPLNPSLTPPGGPLLRTLSGLSDSIEGVAVYEKQGWVFSASKDGTIKVWGLETGQEMRTLTGHTDVVHEVAVYERQGWAVSASKDRTLKVWDLETGLELHTLKGHTDWVLGVAVYEKQGWAVSTCEDGTLKVWDLETGLELHTLTGHIASVHEVAVYERQGWVVSASKDRTLKVWDLETGLELHTLKGHTDWVLGVAVYEKQGWAVSTCEDGTLKVWDLKIGQELRTLTGHTDWVSGVGLYERQGWVVSASSGWNLKVWDLETGRELGTLTGHTGPIVAVEVCEKRGWAVSASLDRTLKVWDLEMGRELRTFTGHTDWIREIVVYAKMGWAISASEDRTLKVWDLETGRELRALTGHTDWVNGVAVYERQGWAVSASDDRTLKVWDLKTGEVLRTLTDHTDMVRGVGVYERKGWAVSASRDGTLKVWDLLTGETLRTLSGHTGPVLTVAVNTEQGWAISASLDQTLKIWDLETGRELRTLTGHNACVRGLVVYAKKGWAISASEDRTLKVWDLETGRELHTLTGHTDWVNGVAVYERQGWAVSASDDRTLKVWDLKRGVEIATFETDGPCTALALNPRRCIVVAGGQGGELHFLRLEGVDEQLSPLGRPLAPH